MTTAADDGAIRRNPCQIKGGGGETSIERTVLTVPQVFALSEAVGPRHRALVLLATFTSLRWGELCALRRFDLDVDARTIRVQRSLTELENGGLTFGPPKTEAGRRTVAYPELISPVIRWHLSCFAPSGHTGNTLTAAAGANLRELMARMGHSSTRAAVIYLHSTDERQRQIADALGDLAAGELQRKTSRTRRMARNRSGTQHRGNRS
jgi:integrase